VDKFELQAPHELSTFDDEGNNSVQILVAADGCALVETEGAPPAMLAKGDAVVVPACTGRFRVRPQWQVEFLRAAVPGKPVPEPATRI
jgi:hypothetical protein